MRFTAEEAAAALDAFDTVLAGEVARQPRPQPNVPDALRCVAAALQVLADAMEAQH